MFGAGSLSRRLILGAGVFITAALVVAGVVILFALHRFVQGQIDQRLDSQILFLSSTLQMNNDGTIALTGAADGPPFDRMRHGWYWQIIGPKNVLTSRSLREAKLEIPDLSNRPPPPPPPPPPRDSHDDRPPPPGERPRPAVIRQFELTEKVHAYDPKANTALIDVVGVRRKVDLGLLQDNLPVKGDWVLIHVGFAMSKISEEDALDQMRTLRMLGEAEAAMQEVEGYGLENAANLKPS